MTMFSSRITILSEDFFSRDLGEYDVLVCYLSHQHMAKIEERLDGMKKPPLVISCAFPMPNAKPTEVVAIKQIVSIKIYAYNSQAKG